MKCRVTHGRVRQAGDVYVEGDVIEVRESVYDALDDRLEPVDESDNESDSETDERASELADEHWQTVVNTIEDGDADEFLDELAEIDDRDSVQEAIDDRR